MNDIFTWLTSNNFKTAFKNILELKQTRSLLLDDIIKQVHLKCLETRMDDDMKMVLVERLAQIEYRLAQGANERAQLASLVGVFTEVRTLRS